ncbi:MAG: hypothetical protein MI750_14065 [Xanthomonadales bacterium]|nr:hypothetical protein [Xanthomonadales bacterium]
MMSCRQVLDQGALQELRDVAGDQLSVVLSDFLVNGKRHENRLLHSRNVRDWDTFAKVTHDIKGAYGYLGATHLLEHCMCMLRLVKEESANEQQLMDTSLSLIAEFQDVRAELSHLVAPQTA